MVQLENKKYEPSVTLYKQVELPSLIGDVAQKDGKPVVHAHVVIGKKDGTALRRPSARGTYPPDL
jgi:predicted DNA-binding protein with PD1-like motif